MNARVYLRTAPSSTVTRTCFFLFGLGCGLPYPLVGSTLGILLLAKGETVALVGFASWALLPYSLKPLWSYLIDKKKLPGFARLKFTPLGWLIWSQIGCVVSLLMLGAAIWASSIAFILLIAVILAFAGATQDCAVDALRVQLEGNGKKFVGLLTTYQLGYRVALLISDGLILVGGSKLGWNKAYWLVSLAFLAPICGALVLSFVSPHDDADQAKTSYAFSHHVKNSFYELKMLVGSVPRQAWILIIVFRLPDLITYPMVNPLLLAAGLDDNELAVLHSGLSLPVSIIMIFLADQLARRKGVQALIVFGASLQLAGMICVSVLCVIPNNGIIIWGCLSVYFAASALTGSALSLFLTNLCSDSSPAFQFSVLIAVYSFVGKAFGGFGGALVDYTGGSSVNGQKFIIVFAVASVAAAFSLLVSLTRKVPVSASR